MKRIISAEFIGSFVPKYVSRTKPDEIIFHELMEKAMWFDTSDKHNQVMDDLVDKLLEQTTVIRSVTIINVSDTFRTELTKHSIKIG